MTRIFCYGSRYCFRYLPARLNAKEGSITKTVANNNLINISLVGESGVSGPEAVRTIKIPMIPKAIEAPIKIRVAIFCIILVYQ